MLTPPQRHDAWTHAAEQWPNEACGFLIAGEYVAVANEHPHPLTRFRIDPRLYGQAVESGGLQAIVHSHTLGQAQPSAADMQGQIDTGVPWIIVVCTSAGAPIEDFAFPASLDGPLTGVAFRPGVEDCYTAIRRWWHQKRGVLLPEFPRDKEWWRNGGDLYTEGFGKAGFRRYLPGERPEPGDVGLMRFGNSKALNHGVVYAGGNLIFHHLPTRVARTEPVGPYLRRVELWLRYDPTPPQGPR